MKRIFISITVFAMIAFLAIACQQAQVAQGPQETVKMDSNQWVNASNQQLASFPVKGFGYKDAAVPGQEWDGWAAKAAPVVKQVIDQLPDGYVLQVTGHTDSRGPEYPVGNKPGNTKISTDRALNVHTALRNKGISSPKMTYKGVGSSQPLSGAATDDPAQRRVTFQVVPKQ